MSAIDGIPFLDFTPDPNETKMYTITRTLRNMGYDIGIARNAIQLIEHKGVDKFNFDYPYGSFEAFKKHTLAGEYDPEDLIHMSQAEKNYYGQLIKAGILHMNIHPKNKI